MLIVADDLGTTDVSAYGYPSAIPTPNIDRIAARGVKFNRGYATASVCSPSRAGLLTGQYQQRHGFEYLAPSSVRQPDGGLQPGQTLLAEKLKVSGYRTVGIGKWHLGVSADRLPTARGFDEFFGFLGGETSYISPEAPSAINQAAPYVGERSFRRDSDANQIGRWRAGTAGRELIRNEGEYLTDALTEEAVSQIRQQRGRDQPLFLYLAHAAPHSPFQATKKYYDRFPREKDPLKRTYAAMVSALDDGVGRVMAALVEAGIADNTIVIFTSDNGAATYFGISDCTHLSGGKLSYNEGGARVPLIVSWPGSWPKGVQENRNVSHLDLYPTILAAAGIKGDKTLDGVDLTPRLGKVEPIHEALFWRTGAEFAALMGDWKLMSNTRPNSFPWTFDLKSDPRETRNRMFDQPERTRELQARFAAWQAQMKPPAWAATSGFQVFHCGRVVFHDQ
ncbi:sulfatase-like hydrolase/transferase [Phenylobacterium sp.]|uniref:sulfatase-like hydrolase/transferase n=1 Tax=Phenylobacterium sp. TaxID=1871053 RepID=UPI003D2884B4